MTDLSTHKVVSHEQWIEARKRHLKNEKEFTRLRDKLSQERRDLPWELVEKDYVFEGEGGRLRFEEVFDGRSQLAIYHAMFDPANASPHTSWTKDAACFVCSFWMDQLDGIAPHLHHRDITIAAVSIAPYDKIAVYKKRMGWQFPYLSSQGSDFNYDLRVSLSKNDTAYNYDSGNHALLQAPGISLFLLREGRIYHTYSTYARGLDMLNLAYQYIDLSAKGRDEEETGPMGWLRRHDEYED